MLNLFCVLGLLGAAATAVQAAPTPQPGAIDRAFNRLYNYDFAGAHAILDEELLKRPEDPLIYAVRGAAYLFSEFDRLKILELEFFADDDKVTDRKKLKPDPKAREQLFKVIGEARKRALARLAVYPNDHEAMFALCTAAGTETDYVGLIEKKYFRTYSLSKDQENHNHRFSRYQPSVSSMPRSRGY
jgi:hypothetical protein